MAKLTKFPKEIFLYKVFPKSVYTGGCYNL